VSLRVATFQSDQYQISTPVYEGPLDLLLDLIEKAELDITSLALATVTDQYLDYMKQLQEQDPAEVSIFLVIAARLLQIKSAALLPHPSLLQSNSNEEDPGEALAQQLRDYKRFKELSSFLKTREDEGVHSFLRLNIPRPKTIIKADLEDLTMESFLSAAKDAFSIRRSVPLDTVVKMPKIRIKDKIRGIVDWFNNHASEKPSFTKMVEKATRSETVVSFLAMLELIKQRMIVAEQEKIFGEIIINPTENLVNYQDTDIEFID